MGESTAAPKYAGDKKVLKAKFAHTEEEAPLNFFSLQAISTAAILRVCANKRMPA